MDAPMTDPGPAPVAEPQPAKPESGVGRLGTIVVVAITAAVIVAVSVLANGGQIGRAHV